ncbi:undecaprenyl-diphosphate phosphatase [Izhakiella australiensis]|uniref:undecaprenyl-diphosphate phosphatase n=1 Tax=Izhakiella australiensis TaxID=1926881 RepID=A0A1S8YP05_9GAMM|nr:undecaprenyl-diphosphate phosphatase [Izhakiella australiensis]OON40901.1 undecaprenyl-diphosphate phosphatase [Izhakiella australiensis]
MESLNSALFLWINATPHSPHWLVALAIFFARDLIAIVPGLIIALWLWGPRDELGVQRVLVLKTGIALIYAMAIAWCLGLLFPHPRPFAIGLGYQLLPHIANGSYPSDHGTAIFTCALAFFCWHRRWSGTLLLAIGVAIAWSRIYLGIHWPLDMLGGFLVGCLGCLFSQMAWKLYGDPLLLHCASLYRLIFAIPIRKGWVRN